MSLTTSLHETPSTRVVLTEGRATGGLHSVTFASLLSTVAPGAGSVTRTQYEFGASVGG